MKASRLLYSALIAALPLGVFAFYGFSTSSPTLDTYRVGDIVYSALKPEDFKKEHGDGWLLMKGDTIKDSRLSTDYHISILPDACGRFLRGMNYNGHGDDPQKERTVMSYQADEFKKHQHNTSAQFKAYGAPGCGDCGACPEYGSTPSGEAGGDETRPKNIALYVYIKVND